MAKCLRIRGHSLSSPSRKSVNTARLLANNPGSGAGDFVRGNVVVAKKRSPLRRGSCAGRNVAWVTSLRRLPTTPCVAPGFSDACRVESKSGSDRSTCVVTSCWARARPVKDLQRHYLVVPAMTSWLGSSTARAPGVCGRGPRSEGPTLPAAEVMPVSTDGLPLRRLSFKSDGLR